jgi:hypothetical protein
LEGFCMVDPADNTRFDNPNSRAAAIAATAQYFVDLRRYLQRTPDQIAYRLHTDASVVLALETGAFQLLPPLQERHRIILAYAALADLDGQPLWTCIENLISPPVSASAPLSSKPRQPVLGEPLLTHTAIPQAQAAPTTHWQAMEQSNLKPSLLARATSAASSPFASVSKFSPKLPSIPRFGARTPWRTGIAITVIAAIAITWQTSILQAGVNKLPSPVSRLVWGATDAVMLQFVKRFEGLPWIDSANPRSRRGNKLAVAKRTNP